MSLLHRWVRQTFGDTAVPRHDLVVKDAAFDSLLLCRGPGSEPGEFCAKQFSAQRFIYGPDDEHVWGTQPVCRDAAEELGLRLTDGRMVWMPRARQPLKVTGKCQCQPLHVEDANVTEARRQRVEKHPRMRELLSSLARIKFSSQAALARTLGVRPAVLSEYQTGMARSKPLSAEQLNTRHGELTRLLERAGLLPADVTAAGLPTEIATKTPLYPHLSKPTPNAPASSTNVPPRTTPRQPASSPVLILNLSESPDKRQGGQVLFMALGQKGPADDERWM